MYGLVSICLSIIGILGVTANVTIIYLFATDKKLRNPVNFLILNLTVSDLSVAVFGNPFALASAWSGRWLFGHVGCIYYGFLMAFFGICSITTLMLLAIERYFSVTRPFIGHKLSYKGALVMIIVGWSYAGLVTIPPLLGWGEYINETANISCSVNWKDRSPSNRSYVIYLFIFGLFIPLFTILFSYYNIVRTLRSNVPTMRLVSRAEKRVVGMVATMITAFLVAWTPYAVLALTEAFTDVEVPIYLTVLPALLAKSSICYNPFIYVGLNTQENVGASCHKKSKMEHESCNCTTQMCSENSVL